jgi:hypothetical protein
MKYHIKSIGRLIKGTFIGTVLTLALFLGIFSPPSETNRQSFDIKAAAIISVGIGATIRLVLYHDEKV